MPPPALDTKIDRSTSHQGLLLETFHFRGTPKIIPNVDLFGFEDTIGWYEELGFHKRLRERSGQKNRPHGTRIPLRPSWRQALRRPGHGKSKIWIWTWRYNWSYLFTYLYTWWLLGTFQHICWTKTAVKTSKKPNFDGYCICSIICKHIFILNSSLLETIYSHTLTS